MEKITKQLLDNLFFVDLEKGKFFWKSPNKFHKDLFNKEAGCIQSTKNKSYWVIKINGKKYKRGRLLFLYIFDRFPNKCIDHIDGNSLNDLPENLREATILENCWNHKKRKKSSDLPMGIRKNKNKFVARISCNKKHITIGSFEKLEDAVKAYKEKRIELYGKFSGY